VRERSVTQAAAVKTASYRVGDCFYNASLKRRMQGEGTSGPVKKSLELSQKWAVPKSSSQGALTGSMPIVERDITC